MNFVETVLLPSFLASGSALAALKYFGDKLIGHRLAKDLASFKADLGQEAETLKTRLAIFAHRENVASSRADGQRSQAIHDVFGQIRRVIHSLETAVLYKPSEPRPNDEATASRLGHLKDAQTHCVALGNAIADSAIYFDSATFRELAQFADTAHTAASIAIREVGVASVAGYTSANSHEIEISCEMLRRTLYDDLQPRCKRVTGIFRAALGIERLEPRPGNAGDA